MSSHLILGPVTTVVSSGAHPAQLQNGRMVFWGAHPQWSFWLGGYANIWFGVTYKLFHWKGLILTPSEG